MTNALSRNTNPADLARGQLLRMAQSAQAQGMVYEAIHIYNGLLDQYPTTEESHEAVEALVRLAQFLEGQGMYYTAKGLYQRLEDLG